MSVLQFPLHYTRVACTLIAASSVGKVAIHRDPPAYSYCLCCHAFLVW